jgi:carbamoyltransferase
MVILGISAYYHDSAACLIKDGNILVAVEEERFTRIKHDNSFPYQAIDFCLNNQGLKPQDIDYVAYYEKPLLKFERILETFVDTYPLSLHPFLKGMPEWLDYKIKVEATIRKLGFKNQIFFVPHHFSHAAASFYPSPFEKSAILTVDGVGEWQTTGLWKGENNKIKPLKFLNFPHSLGLLYSAFTAFLGFKVNEDEYKVMGLAAYGKPTFVNRIHSVVDIKNDGSFRFNLKYFGFRESFSMFNRQFIKLFGSARNSKDKITKKHQDIAASIQIVTEEIYFKMLNYLYSITKTENLCLSGGVALNALANGKIYERTPFKKVYIFGAAGDSGAAVGAGLFAYHSVIPTKVGYSPLGEIQTKRQIINNLYLGSQYSNDQIEQSLKKYKLNYKKFTNENELIDKTAKLLAQGKIIGWFQGRCEFGPRALGNRSILCRPNPRNMKTKMNLIKLREQFRPFAGSILQEKVHKYFKIPKKNHWSPFMTFCFQVKNEKKQDLAAIVHPDGTCRIQTVSKINGRYFLLIKKFYQLTGLPCILNTSFNLQGEPIVETPEQAISDFLKTKMDYLVIEDFLIAGD